MTVSEMFSEISGLKLNGGKYVNDGISIMFVGNKMLMESEQVIGVLTEHIKDIVSKINDIVDMSAYIDRHSRLCISTQQDTKNSGRYAYELYLSFKSLIEDIGGSLK